MSINRSEACLSAEFGLFIFPVAAIAVAGRDAAQTNGEWVALRIHP